MNNKIGLIVGALSGLIYTIADDGFDNHNQNFITASLSTIAQLIGILIIPAVLALVITFFSKKKNFGENFAYTCIFLFLFTYYGKH